MVTGVQTCALPIYKYDFLDKPKARCPICDMKIQVSSCVLYKCGVSFKGFLYNTKSNKMKEIEIIDFTSSNISVKYYNPFDQSDENLSWNKLSVDTKRIDGIKTKQEIRILSQTATERRSRNC